MLLARIERYMRARRMAPTRFGRETLRDPWLVENIRAGRRLRPETIKRLEAALDRMEADLPGNDPAGEGA